MNTIKDIISKYRGKFYDPLDNIKDMLDMIEEVAEKRFDDLDRSVAHLQHGGKVQRERIAELETNLAASQEQVESEVAHSKSLVDACRKCRRIADLEAKTARLRDLLQDRDAEIIELRGRVLKVVRPHKGDMVYDHCDCGCAVYVTDKYCLDCGARLDWSEVQP